MANINTSPAEIQKYLKGIDYPADKDDLIAAAEEEGAPEDVINKLKELPGDSFNSPVDVMKAFGETT